LFPFVICPPAYIGSIAITCPNAPCFNKLKDVVARFQKRFDKDSPEHEKSNEEEKESVSVDRRSIIDEYIEEE
jgi:hypothetical protein